MNTRMVQAKPFLKWAGGKGQLIEQMSHFFPQELKLGKVKNYVEPFIGSGAVFFHIAQSYKVEKYFISDINEELVLAYQTLCADVDSVIDVLAEIQHAYYQLNGEEQKSFFYETRAQFNTKRPKIDFSKFDSAWITRTAQLIFLNRTCFNGLFRVNANARFNVPFGRYKNPKICAVDNLRKISKLLQNTEIIWGSFQSCENFVDEHTFVYFDPPYRPISSTSNFTTYSNFNFDDQAQLDLAAFFRKLDQRGAQLMLSNSDPKNNDPNDNFFEQAYEGYRIERVMASRMINCDAKKRGQLHELLVMNYS
jgi:DNA adenine methylase